MLALVAALRTATTATTVVVPAAQRPRLAVAPLHPAHALLPSAPAGLPGPRCITLGPGPFRCGPVRSRGLELLDRLARLGRRLPSSPLRLGYDHLPDPLLWADPPLVPPSRSRKCRLLVGCQLRPRLPPYHYHCRPLGGLGPWDQNALAGAFSTVPLTPLAPYGDWYMDSGATSDMATHPGILSLSYPPSPSSPSSIIVGNGAPLPVTTTGSASVGQLCLDNVLISPKLITNLVSIRQFTIDNSCSVEFDPFGFSVKDLRTQHMITRCNSFGPLYPLRPSTATTAFLTTASPELWHQCLGHPGSEALPRLDSTASITCNKNINNVDLYHACQLGRHVRLPFSSSQSRARHPFDLIHCDLWTSPVPSMYGFKYYLANLDDCSHHLWTFPLRLKFDTFSTIAHFFSYVATQFRTTIKSVQCDNGREFDNSSSRAFFLSHGVILRMSCPYTSQQNGKAERVLRTVNNIIRSLFFHAHLPLSSGLRLFIPPPIFSTVTPLKPSPFPPLTRPCTILLPTTPTSVSLAVDVIPISPPPCLITLLPGHLFVCFLDTPTTTKVTVALTLPPTAS
jgi:hypothetical protein